MKLETSIVLFLLFRGGKFIVNIQKIDFNNVSSLTLGIFQLVDTTVELANKVGAAEIISRIVDDLKDEAEQYRKMVMETIEKIMGNLGAADIDHKLEEQLIDGILYAFQEQTTEVRGVQYLLDFIGRQLTVSYREMYVCKLFFNPCIVL